MEMISRRVKTTPFEKKELGTIKNQVLANKRILPNVSTQEDFKLLLTVSQLIYHVCNKKKWQKEL